MDFRTLVALVALVVPAGAQGARTTLSGRIAWAEGNGSFDLLADMAEKRRKPPAGRPVGDAIVSLKPEFWGMEPLPPSQRPGTAPAKPDAVPTLTARGNALWPKVLAVRPGQVIHLVRAGGGVLAIQGVAIGRPMVIC